MSSNVPDEMNPSRFSSPSFPTVGAIIVILVNVWVVWFILYIILSGCTRLAAESGGRQTCGLEPGAYAIAGISGYSSLSGFSIY